MDKNNNYDAQLYNRIIYQQQADEEKKVQQELDSQSVPEGESSSSDQASFQKAPEDFNTGDNVKELGRAVAGGVVDIYNSVVSLPKLLDKRFYQATDPENPWTYDSPLLIKNKPITHTKWGGFVRGGIELAGGAVGAGKVLGGIKGLKG